MKNRYQLRQYIRFQLEQMSPRNEHHLFEELAFELARQTVSRRLIPATGPVQAGGDQGRDFESFRSHIANGRTPSGVAAGIDGDSVLVFGCTLDKKLEGKIRGDIGTMCSGDPKPDAIYYYAGPDLAVAKRHKLQAWCRREHGAELEIFDGQAIASLLAEPEHFWIAEQFLAVPAEMYPPIEADGEYARLKDRWFDAVREIANQADLIEVKRGLRKATFTPEFRPDLGRWLTLMEGIARSQEGAIQRKALYEIAVAHLRGRGQLDPVEWALDRFFESFAGEADPDPTDVEDATVLASYVSSACRQGDYSAPLEKALAWTKQARVAIDRALAGDLATGSRFRLLLVRGHLDFDAATAADTGDVRAERLLTHWELAMNLAAESPFADADALATLLEMVVPVIGEHPRFRALADRVDDVVAERGGKAAAADQARRRALGYLQADRLTSAIDQLQRVKEGWFTSENMHGSVLAMLQLAQAYLTLNLPLAARYYAAAAFYAIGHHTRDGLRPMISHAAFLYANTYLLNGEGLTYMAAAGRAAELHLSFSADPEDLEKQDEFSAAIAQSSQMRAMIATMAPALLPHADAILDGWTIDSAYGRSIREMSGKKPWSAMSVREVEAKLAEQTGQGLFNDLGDTLRFQWHALGIDWSIEADAGSRIHAERIGAALQIALVDLSDEDLLIIPGDVHVRVEIGVTSESTMQQQPDNGVLTFVITLPASGEAGDETARTMAMVSTMILQATAMPFEAYRAVLETKMKRGLTARAFWVQPAGQLLSDVRTLLVGGLPDLTAESQPNLAEPPPLAHPDLAWRDGPAPGYSARLARIALQNRYSRTAVVAREVVPQLMVNPTSRRAIDEQHRSGVPDWQLINAIYSIVLNASVEEESRETPLHDLPVHIGVMRRAMERLEAGQIPDVDPAAFTADALQFQMDLNVLATLKGWGLELHRQTPDADAVRRFLDARYNGSTDDIPHENHFGWALPTDDGSSG
ncbi:hypothetical protein [Sphingomonas sp. CFBP 8760]|uniref:hypothetical protein n=1 Tax=Sphingomonas sp. CFBP 8760 TaxID=2775282 RepID=UPI00177DEA21|nr:hypothetical protein [Sphingomonas sp. CFBP 8760]MBD8548258.1 hypothetical protein [Sphingomonas sp. CFBP 8760]